MDHMKYIIVEDSCPMSMVFNPVIEHKKAATGVCGVSGKKVVGAGFCSIGITVEESQNDFGAVFEEKLVVSCWGESVSLNIKSRGEEDAKVILRDLERGHC